MKYRDRLNEVLKASGCNGSLLAAFAFCAYLKKHFPGNARAFETFKTSDFTESDSEYGKFMSAESEDDVILMAYRRVCEHDLEMKFSKFLLVKGEELIRDAYRIAALNDLKKPHDVIAGQPVTHDVSLEGVYDDKDFYERGGDR